MSRLIHDEHLDLDGNRIHISADSDDDWNVWLNTDVDDFDGLCIGCGQSRKEAVAEAISVLDEGLRKLRHAADQAASVGGE